MIRSGADRRERRSESAASAVESEARVRRRATEDGRDRCSIEVVPDRQQEHLAISLRQLQQGGANSLTLTVLLGRVGRT